MMKILQEIMLENRNLNLVDNSLCSCSEKNINCNFHIEYGYIFNFSCLAFNLKNKLVTYFLFV